MSIEYTLIEDTITANKIPANADFLQWEVSMIHADGFTLEYSMDEDNSETSKSHWAIIVETTASYIRLSMESRENNRTGVAGVLVLKLLSYSGLSENVVHRETFSSRGTTIKVQDILDLVFAQGWHKYKMLKTVQGAKKGCRHHIQTMLTGFQSKNWIGNRSDRGKSVEEFLHFVYTRDADGSGKIFTEPKSIDLGQFLERP